MRRCRRRANRRWPGRRGVDAIGEGSTLVVGQSGGPTAAINASLYGVVAAARAAGVKRILGMRFGIEGLLKGDLVDLGRQPASFFEHLRSTPAAALGSCRHRLTTDELVQVLERVRRESVRCIVYIGGNDSADTSHRLHEAAQAGGFDLTVVGVPKTIDNDLAGTDHCPGYGSAARFVAQTTAEAGLDTESMRHTDPLKLVEVMGRHAGWLAAAAWLGKRDERDAPQLVYLPEAPVSPDEIFDDVEDVLRRLGYGVVVLCENQPGPNGRVLGADAEPRWVDAFGHAYYSSPAEYLADQLRQRLGIRVRIDKPGTIQRMSRAHQSTVDLQEAELAGRAAVGLCLEGRSDLMVTLVREGDSPYVCSTGTAPLVEAANRQRPVPGEFISSGGWGMTAAFERYARPLLGEALPEYARVR